MSKNEYAPDSISAPGETLQDLMIEKQIDIKTLSKLCSVTPNVISQILDGDAKLSRKLAQKLGEVFGQSTEFWLERDLAYQEFRANHDSFSDFEGDDDDLPEKQFVERMPKL